MPSLPLRCIEATGFGQSATIAHGLFIRDRDHRRTVIDMYGDLRPHFDQQTRQSLPFEAFDA